MARLISLDPNQPAPTSPSSGGTSSGSGSSSGSSGSGSGSGGGSQFSFTGGGSQQSFISPASTGPGQGAAAALSTFMQSVVRGAADRAEYPAYMAMGPNDVVQIAPNRSNTQPCFVGTMGPDSAKFGPRMQLASTDNPVTVSVRNLGEISVYSTIQGEGVTITVQRKS